jgi:tRNA dimethylallyltransferase
MTNKPKLIVIVGPTAVGKTPYSIELALKKNCPIISADSRQFYKEISIGTAKPTEDEMKGVPHFFINSHSIKEIFTAGDYEHSAINLLHELFLAHKEVIVVGGSGLYINALCFGFDPMPKGNESIRQELHKIYQEKGIIALQEQLKQIDPEFFKVCEQKNPQRLMRAIEICLISGKSNLELRKLKKEKKRFFDIEFIGLEMPKLLLKERIEKRVDTMIENGLVNEALSVVDYRSHYALKTVGYREIFSYFDGKISLDEAVFLIKKNTIEFARKQITWFKKNPLIKWITI